MFGNVVCIILEDYILPGRLFKYMTRAFLQQRTKAGLEAARKRGRLGGRPAIDADTKRRIIKLFESGESATDIAKEYRIGRSTIYKILKENDQLS